VKFQTVLASTELERSPNPADSGKKVLPGVGRFRFFCGLAQRRAYEMNTTFFKAFFVMP